MIVTLAWACTAASSVGAEPSCRYGEVAQTSRNVGTSMPPSGPPRRLPLDGLIVPMSTRVSAPLPVKAAPAWHAAQSSATNTDLPAEAAADSVPAAGRAGAGPKAFSDATYAVSASRSVERPAFASPSGVLRVPARKRASDISPVPPASARICPSKSCTSLKLALQCRKPWAPARPRSAMVLRSPSPRLVRSHTRPSWPPSLWQLAQLM